MTEVMKYSTNSLLVSFCIHTLILTTNFGVEALSQQLERSIESRNDSLLLVDIICERFFIGHRTVRLIGVSEVISSEIPLEVYGEIE